MGVGGCELICRVVVIIVMSPLLDDGRDRVAAEETELDMPSRRSGEGSDSVRHGVGRMKVLKKSTAHCWTNMTWARRQRCTQQCPSQVR